LEKIRDSSLDDVEEDEKDRANDGLVYEHGDEDCICKIFKKS
jgi:hypothetical protein